MENNSWRQAAVGRRAESGADNPEWDDNGSEWRRQAANRRNAAQQADQQAAAARFAEFEIGAAS